VKGTLALALRFGVTTELEMQGTSTRDNRAQITENDSVADVRSSGLAITPPGGHPSELFPQGFQPGGEDPGDEYEEPAGGAQPVMPFCTTPAEAVSFVPKLVAAGSDYIKFMVDDGTVEGHPGLPMLDQATLNAGVAQAHRHGMLTVAHALTVDAARMAIEAGITGATFAEDPRVSSRLDAEWLATLHSSFNRYPQGKLTDVLASVKALRDAGVDVIVGTDASVPVGLDDRGRIAEGLRADLLLVDGDPTTTISDTLNLQEVWRRGTRTTL
jgi:imidazolonepropionase-like amidohydrolase